MNMNLLIIWLMAAILAHWILLADTIGPYRTPSDPILPFMKSSVCLVLGSVCTLRTSGSLCGVGQKAFSQIHRTNLRGSDSQRPHAYNPRNKKTV